MNAVAGSIPAAALAIEQAGAAALRGALARFRSIPIFLPTAVGGGGAFLRAPKPGCKPATTPPTLQPTSSSAGLSRVWPKHHPFPQYLGGAAEQTLKKIPKNLHHRFHAALDKWKGGKYSRSKRAEHFKGFDRKTVIRDLRDFYNTAEGGIFKKYLPDFEKAVIESQ